MEEGKNRDRNNNHMRGALVLAATALLLSVAGLVAAARELRGARAEVAQLERRLSRALLQLEGGSRALHLEGGELGSRNLLSVTAGADSLTHASSDGSTALTMSSDVAVNIGSVRITGANIGVSTDTDLLGLATGQATLRGDLSVTGVTSGASVVVLHATQSHSNSPATSITATAQSSAALIRRHTFTSPCAGTLYATASFHGYMTNTGGTGGLNYFMQFSVSGQASTDGTLGRAFINQAQETFSVEAVHSTFTGLTKSTSYVLDLKAYVQVSGKEFVLSGWGQDHIHAFVVCS